MSHPAWTGHPTGTHGLGSVPHLSHRFPVRFQATSFFCPMTNFLIRAAVMILLPSIVRLKPTDAAKDVDVVTGRATPGTTVRGMHFLTGDNHPCLLAFQCSRVEETISRSKGLFFFFPSLSGLFLMEFGCPGAAAGIWSIPCLSPCSQSVYLWL